MNWRLGVVLTVTLSASAGYTLPEPVTVLRDWRDGAAAETTRPAEAPRAEPHAAPSSPSGWTARPTPLIDEPDHSPEQDLYGNDISDAVARYKFDAEGTVYEEHSPETEIPHLRPPTT